MIRAAALALLALLPAAERDARSFVLRAGTLYPGDGPPQKNVAVVVRDGRIDAVLPEGAELPADLPVVDRRDAVVTPGLVVAETALSDGATEGRFRAAFGTVHVFRAVDPLRRAIDGFAFTERRDALLGAGVTTVYLSPGRDRLVNGRGAVVKLAGRDDAERTLRPLADLEVSVGDDPANVPPFFDPPLPPSAENRMPTPEAQFSRTRAGASYAVRGALRAALDGPQGKRAVRDAKTTAPFDPEAAELADLLLAKAPMRVHTTADADVASALALLREFGLKGAIVGAAEAEAHAKALKDADVAAVVEIAAIAGREPASPKTRVDATRLRPETAAALRAAGVRVAIAPSRDTALEAMPLVLAAAVGAGMSRADAVRAVTAEAARILGVDARVGVIAPGRDADLVVWNGAPGDTATSVAETYASGERVFSRDAIERRRRDAWREKPAGGSVVVRAGLVLPISGPAIANGAVSIHNGRILGVGREVPVPPGARVIDAGADAVVTPGLIDAQSFLGLEDDRAMVTGIVPLEHLANPNDPDFRFVAAGGVTTVLVQGVAYSPAGSPIAALKTGGASDAALVRETCGIGIPTLGPTPEPYRALLTRAKQYSERWDKYFADVDREQAEAKKAAAEGSKPAEEKKEEPKKETEGEKVEVDPVTGTWEGKMSGGPLPAPQPFTMRLRLRGTEVTGTVSGRAPGMGREEVELTGGTFHDNTIHFEISRPEIPFPIVVDAKIDRPDHLAGTLDVRMFKIDLEATRTEKAAPILGGKAKTKKKGVEMPPVDDNLEPFRRLFHGDATLVVGANAKDDIQTAVAVVVDEFKLPLAIAGGAEAGEVAALLAAKKVGFVAGPAFPSAARKPGLPVAAAVALAGAPLAIASRAGTGARDLRQVGAYAVSLGLGGDQVLRAMTLDAATMFR
ncbi:MAG TPA: amidohydrolase family protein, partial [Planctomycetota bacterium]|nr:amidohydrolase family protein [Planctomycetota bacterium]